MTRTEQFLEPDDSPGQTRRYTVGKDADLAIERLLCEYGGGADLYLHDLIVSALKLGQESAGTGDLRLVNAAVKEMRHAFRVFAPYQDRRKVSIFGSARTPSDHPWSELAREYAREMARRSWMVITGGASGVMGAGIEGAGREAAFGALIRLPFEETPCPVLDGDPKQIRFRYFFTRKLVFVKESHAICLLPGGFGTHDEAFETMTLIQTGKTPPRPVLLLEDAKSGFWTEWLEFHQRHLIDRSLVSEDDFSFISVVRSPEEAAEATVGFYRIYHSLRMVGDRLVVRMTSALPEGALDVLEREHLDVLASGGFEQCPALAAEANEPEIADLPRLVFVARQDRPIALYRLIERLNRF